MTCPPVQAFAQLLEGSLTPAERSELERHVDRCPLCTELLGQLGKVYGGPSTLAPNEAPGEGASAGTKLVEPRQRLALFHGVLVLCSVAVAVALGGLSAGEGGSLGLRVLHGAGHYAVLGGPVGVVVGAAAIFGTWSGQRWARGARILHAVLALPTLVLAPVAAYVLVLGVRPPGAESTCRTPGHGRRLPP